MAEPMFWKEPQDTFMLLTRSLSFVAAKALSTLPKTKTQRAIKKNIKRLYCMEYTLFTVPGGQAYLYITSPFPFSRNQTQVNVC